MFPTGLVDISCHSKKFNRISNVHDFGTIFSIRCCNLNSNISFVVSQLTPRAGIERHDLNSGIYLSGKFRICPSVFYAVPSTISQTCRYFSNSL